MSKLRTLLIHPPQYAMYSPFLAIPTVTAYVRQQGYSCDQWDLNLQVNRRFLTREWIDRCVERARRRAGNGSSSPDAAVLERADAVAEALPGALAALKRRENLLDDETLLRAFGVIDEAYGIISAAHAPTCVSYNLQMRYAVDRFEDIEAAIRDEDENPYIELFREEVVPRIVEGGYGLVGIGVAFDEQLVPAITLARLIKERAPDIHVVAGGTLMTKLSEGLQKVGRLFSPLDTAILYEGETPLTRLIDHLEGRLERHEVPNLLHPSGDGGLALNHLMSENVAELPPPDFDGFPLDDYLLPDVIFPMLTTRGCYWKKCAFCTHHHSYGWRYRVRDKGRLIEDIRTLQNRFGARYFYFVDEAVPPSNLKVVADYGVTERGRDIRWFGDMRFERPLTDDAFCRHLYEGGCRVLIFGMESASQRVLDHMKKGVKVETMSQSLKALHRQGIFSILMYFFGFPTETLQEAQETVKFIEDHRDAVGAHAQGSFMLMEGAPAFNDPHAYGIVSITHPSNDLATQHSYAVRSGLSESAASQIADAIGRKRLRDSKFGQNWSRELILLRQSVEEGTTATASVSSGAVARNRWDAL